MARFKKSSFLPAVLVIVIVIVAVVALVSLARFVFFSGGGSTSAPVTDVSRDALLNTTAAHKVRATVRGPIVADEEFRSYQITITPSSRSLVTYKGYLDTRVDGTDLGNNVAAYEQFVYALDKADLPIGEALTGGKNDLRGICATGYVYEFEIIDGDNIVKQLWTSTCSGSKGSLDASVDQLMELFNDQIPTSEKLIRDLDI